MTAQELYNEQQLLQNIAQGDQRDFALLVERYSAVVYRHILMYMKNALLAEEITQDIFLKIWEGRTGLSSIENFRGYLHVITRNRTISELRKKLQYTTDIPDDELAASLPDPSECLEYRQLSDTLMQGIEQLPPRRRQVFQMSRFEGMSYNEIAGQLNISKGTVNEHIVEALVFLRTYLRAQTGNVVQASVLLHILLSR